MGVFTTSAAPAEAGDACAGLVSGEVGASVVAPDNTGVGAVKSDSARSSSPLWSACENENNNECNETAMSKMKQL